MSVEISSIPKVLDSEHGNYVIVEIVAKVNRISELEELGKDLAKQYNISRPHVQVTALVPRGDKYLIVVTKDDR